MKKLKLTLLFVPLALFILMGVSAVTRGSLAVGGITGLGSNVATLLATFSGANLASALTTALPNSKGGTGGDSSGSTGIAHVSSGTWSWTSVVNADVTSIDAATKLTGLTPLANGGTNCATPYAINPQTTTYQALAADFTCSKTITVASGTFTITLVASGSQPVAGSWIRIANYGSGVVTIARSGQNINGGTGSIILESSSATNPSVATIWSDATNYFAASGFTNPMTTSGDVIQAGTTGLPTRIPCTVGFFKGGTPGSCTGITAADLPVAATVVNSGTITLPSGNAILVICTSTCSVPVPAPVLGYQLCAKNIAGGTTVITLSALGSSAMYPKSDDSGYGTAGTGTMVSSAAAGNKVCLIGKDSTHYELGAVNDSTHWTVN